MISDDRPETPLARAMRYFNLSPPDVIRAADSIALQLGIEPVSRRQLGRYLSGENEPTADKIFVLTSAIQDLTEEPVTAADLFHIQRGGVGQSTPVSLPPRVRSVARRRSLWGALFSQAGVLPQIWRVLVIQAGAPTAEGGFEQLYEQYFVLLYAIARRGYGVPDGAAEELVHDAFMAFLEHHPHVYNVKGWLSATVRNRCMNWKRDHQRETPLAPGDYETADETAQGNIEYCIRRLTAVAVFAQLTDKCRETLLGFIAEEPVDRIAERLLVTTAYAERLVSRCRNRAIAAYRAMRKGRSL